MILKGRKIVGGQAEGEALVSRDPVSFYGGVDPETGVVTERGHAVEGECVTGKIFVFPTGKGSTVGSYVIYRMKKLGTAPAAIVNLETEAILATGCVMSGIPLVDGIGEDAMDSLRSGMRLRVDADGGSIESVENNESFRSQS
jgi:predicted aconitase with swiveling domain